MITSEINIRKLILGLTPRGTGLEILKEFAQIPSVLADPESKSPYALKNLDRGYFYVSGSFVEKDELIKVGPVETKHLGDTPQVFLG